MNWLSYFLGLATLPALVLLFLLARSLLSSLAGGTTQMRNLSGPSSSPSPLQFNRRVVGQLRQSSEVDETTAHAS